MCIRDRESGDKLIQGPGININNGMISNTGDLSANNEIQNLSVNGNQLSISNGNTVTLPTVTTYTEGAGIDINGNAITALDISPTNEIPVSYTHLRAHETPEHLVCRLL